MGGLIHGVSSSGQLAKANVRIAAAPDFNVEVVAPECDLLHRLAGVVDFLIVREATELIDGYIVFIIVVEQEADVSELTKRDAVVALPDTPFMGALHMILREATVLLEGREWDRRQLLA